MPKRNNPTYPPMPTLYPMVCYSDGDTDHQPPEQAFHGKPGQVPMGYYDAGNFGSQHPQQGSSGRGINMNFYGPVHVNIERMHNVCDRDMIGQAGRLVPATAGTFGNAAGNGLMTPPDLRNSGTVGGLVGNRLTTPSNQQTGVTVLKMVGNQWTAPPTQPTASVSSRGPPKRNPTKKSATRRTAKTN